MAMVLGVITAYRAQRQNVAKSKKHKKKKRPGKKKAASNSLGQDLWLLGVFFARLFRLVFGFSLRWFWRIALVFVSLMLLAVSFYAFINPPTTPYMMAEKRRLGEIDRQWVDLEEIAPVMLRSVVAAEDANFCLHWGFDMVAIREALEDGSARGASTISQQVVKNVFLWQGRSWTRKALEALITPVLELVWSKRRILEVYLNVVEFDEGTFGIDAAAHAAFRKLPVDLNARQAARLAVLLPNPKNRSALQPTAWLSRQALRVQDGAATIGADGRAGCFDG